MRQENAQFCQQNAALLGYSELVADHKSDTRQPVIGAVAQIGMGGMFDLGRNIPVAVEAISDGGIFMKKHAATEFRASFARTISQPAVMPQAAKA